ncbi:MAG: LytR C-terminal domain-containing protein [candidate division WOR-3 bacterium]
MKKFLLNFLIFLLIGFVFIFTYSFVESFILKKENKERIEKKKIRVEVLNGTKVPKLAQKVTARIRELGFDVIYYGSYDSEINQTCIFDRKYPDLFAGKMLAKEIRNPKVYFEADPDNLVDITVVIGKDYKKYFPEIEKEWE